MHYASIDENNKIVHELKMEFRDGIGVPRAEIDYYANEDDCILIGRGRGGAEGRELRNWKIF